MASGFANRWKGKQEFDRGALWCAGTQFAGSGADLDVNTGWATVSTYSSTQALPNGGISLITSTAIAVYTLSSPVKGRTILISASSGSTAWMVKGSTVSGVTILGSPAVNGGSSLTFVIKSTSSLVATQVELVGLSTTSYLFMGVAPSTLSHLLFSTAT